MMKGSKWIWALGMPFMLLAQPLNPPVSASGRAQVSQILGYGRVIRLKDGTEYQVEPADQGRSVTWLRADIDANPANKIYVYATDTQDGSKYPIRLRNSRTGETVRAKRLVTDRVEHKIPENQVGWDADADEDEEGGGGD